MKESLTQGVICLNDDLGFVYRIARITYLEREDETFTYRFQPDYSVMELLAPPVFQGIPGLDLSRRKPEYMRENMTPVFISERTPGEGREDLWSLLESHGLSYLNRLEWLIRTETRYGGDRMYVERYDPDDWKRTVLFEDMERMEVRAASLMQRLLQAICLGHVVQADAFRVEDSNRKVFHVLLMALYGKERKYLREQRTSGIQKAAKQGRYTGRKRISLDAPKLEEVFSGYRKGRVTEAEAIHRLKVSRSTFFRRLREWERASGTGTVVQPGARKNDDCPKA